MAHDANKINCIDDVALNAWYVVGVFDDFRPTKTMSIQLLDTELMAIASPEGEVAIYLGNGDQGRRLPCLEKFGYLWTTLGKPSNEIFDIQEYQEADRRRFNGVSLGLHVSGPRVVENFLDLGHLAFVHRNYLGVEPHTAITPYKVAISPDGGEIIATQCVVYQPAGSVAAVAGADVAYMYRVPHPFCAILYKSNAIDPLRRDVIALFVQPVTEERVIAHLLVCVLDDVSSDTEIRRFQQLVLAQDKPILENQLPKRLPLEPAAELSVRADLSSVAYRRWLSRQNLRYGTIPAGGPTGQAS